MTYEAHAVHNLQAIRESLASDSAKVAMPLPTVLMLSLASAAVHALVYALLAIAGSIAEKET